jgi:hypothetical protein
MKRTYLIFAAALVLLPAPALAAPAVGPLDAILSAPLSISRDLVNFAIALPDSLTGQPRKGKRMHGTRTHSTHHVRHARRHQPAYRYKERSPLQ